MRKFLIISGLLLIPLILFAPVNRTMKVRHGRIEVGEIESEYNRIIHLIHDKCQFPEILIKQAKLEQGQDFSGRFFKERNNIWNFQIYRKSMKDYQVLYFPSLDSCVLYMAAWQKRKYKGGDYYKFLKKVGFAKDKKYIQKLKRIK